jgi:DNA repair protein RadC
MDGVEDSTFDGGGGALFPGEGAQAATPARPALQQKDWPGGPLERYRTLDLIEIIASRRTSGDGAASRARASLAAPQDWSESALLRRARAPVLEWALLLRIPARSALRVACAFELGRRAARGEQPARTPIRTPRDAFQLVSGPLAGRERETVVALYLDGRHRLLLLHEVSVGTATASLIHPREVFGPALRCGACAVVIAHNHPSGDPEPSAEDHGVTERLTAAGELVGIPLLDHLVVGASDFVSLRGRGAFGGEAQAGRTLRA